MIIARLRDEVRTLLWLQGRLMRSSLRSGSRQDTLRLIGIGLLALAILPGTLAFNAGLIWVYRVLSPAAAAEVIAILFSVIVLSWLLSPVSNQQIVEPFNLPRLFQYPISLTGLIAGSLVVNVLSLGFIASVPFVLAVVVGMPRSLGSVVPILLAGLLFLAATVVLKALIDDVFALIAEDRQLRTIALAVALIPVVFIVGGELWLQASLMPNGQEPDLNLVSLADVNRFIVGLRISRFLTWQPGGWLGRAVGAAAAGHYGPWFGWTGLLFGFVGVGFALHYTMLRRLYFGELVRVRARRRAGDGQLRALRLRLPFVSPRTAEALWGLLQADWRSFSRNPYTMRMAIAPVMVGLLAIFFAKMMPAPPAGIGAMVGGLAAFVLTMSYGHNLFGILDNPGLATVLQAPVRLRLLLLSHNLLLTVMALGLAVFGGVVVAALLNDLLAALAGFGAALALHVPMLAIGNLTSVYFPYKVDLERGRAAANGSRSSVIAVFAVMGGGALLAAPALLGVLLPFQLAPLLLPAGIVLAVAYLAALYGGLFVLAARALEGRGEAIVAAITQGR